MIRFSRERWGKTIVSWMREVIGLPVFFRNSLSCTTIENHSNFLLPEMEISF